jgi:energy-converting hydrogenase A subunit M
LGEFSLWKQQIKTKPITNVVSTLAEYNENIYHSIYTLLNILASLPVTIATSVRSFSSLKHLKTYLRNTITENRLNGLALMNIHRDVKVTVEKVIENMARKNRRIRLL